MPRTDSGTRTSVRSKSVATANTRRPSCLQAKPPKGRSSDALLPGRMVVTDLMEFAVSYRGGAWTGIVVDIARAEPGESEIEWPQVIPLTQAFGVTGSRRTPLPAAASPHRPEAARHDPAATARQAQRPLPRSDRPIEPSASVRELPAFASSALLRFECGRDDQRRPDPG
jgi:hypothetical protein